MAECMVVSGGAVAGGAAPEMEGFKVEGLLGRGTFASVYRAREPGGSIVALKRVSLDGVDGREREQSLKEAHLLQQLDHPNVIKCHAVFFQRNELVMVLELAGAGDLAKMISTMRSRRQRFPEKFIWKYFGQVTTGLAYMHSQRIIHRDIKPANVFLTHDGHVKVADLGLSRYFASRSDGIANSVVGTPYYMAPERLVQSTYTYSSDVWSTGCLLYELAALRSPFLREDNNLYKLAQKIQRGSYPALPAGIYSDTLMRLVGYCLAVVPSDRPTMKSIADCAQQALHQTTASAETRGPKAR